MSRREPACTGRSFRLSSAAISSTCRSARSSRSRAPWRSRSRSARGGEPAISTGSSAVDILGFTKQSGGWFATALPDWILAPEVSFSFFGERGVIDILAWHPGRRALLVIELKTDLADVNELIGTMDRRRRLAWDIAKERGWEPLTVSTWVLVAGGRTNRARISAHRTLLRTAFPVDGRTVAGWLRRPDREIHALSLWDRVRDDGGGSGELAARHRVRRRPAASVRP